MANTDDKTPKQATIPVGGGDPATGAAPGGGVRRASTTGGGDMVKVTVKHTAPLGLPPMTHERAKQLKLPDLPQEFTDRQLTVGENTIPRAHWDAVKEQTPVVNWIEEGWIYEGSDREARAALTGQTSRESLANLSEDDARRYIDVSNDAGQLARWADTERRPAVRDAIQRRMDAIGAGK